MIVVQGKRQTIAALAIFVTGGIALIGIGRRCFTMFAEHEPASAPFLATPPFGGWTRDGLATTSPGPMEFLLLLSAFLSALTGAISGVRAPELHIHQASAQRPVAAVGVQAPRRAVGARVTQAVADLASAARPLSEPVAWFVAASIPLYADRLRE